MISIRALLVAMITLAPSTALALGGPAPGAVTAQTVKLPSGPGSVRGLADDASVSSFTGQVQYAVPIPLPAGPGGQTPSLSLGYDGGLGNGPLGVGWTLAQPGIQRSLRLGVPHYDATDEIDLVGLGADGQVVKLPNGELRIEGQGNSITGRTVGLGYELTDADGNVYRFGTVAASRKSSGARVSAWYLEELRDVAGNSIFYKYRRDRGEMYLESIEWGPLVGTTRAFRAALEYEGRSDAVVSYRTGFRVESALRLARVRISSFGGVQRVVALAYDETFSLTRVKSVRVTSADGSEALPETSFTYASAQGSAQTAVTGTGGWALNLLGTSLFDVDNDGAMDLLRLSTTEHSWRRNVGGAFAPAADVPGASGASLDQVRLVDLDGDSVAEMVRQEGPEWVVHKLDSASARWIPVGNLSGSANVPLGGVAIADIDGDRRMDVLAPSGSSFSLSMGTAAGLSAPVTKSAIDPLRTFIQPGASGTFFFDLNGDGLADAVHPSSSMFYLYLGRGDGTFERYRDVPFPWLETVTPSQIRLGDLNRDGLLDVVVVRGGNVTWHRGLADGTFATNVVELGRPPGTDASVVVAIADANGNGSEDVVWSSDAGMWILDLAGPTTAGMLVGVDNGLGQTQRFAYQASTTAMFAAEQKGAAWTRTMPISIPVAVQQRKTLASGEPERSSRLEVRDAVYDAEERRFVGFEESTLMRPDPSDGVPAGESIRTTTRFAPGLGSDRVLRGQVVYERIEDGTGKVYRVTTHEVAAVPVAGLPEADPRLRRAIVLATESQHYEGLATPVVTRDEYGHDDEGRVIETRSLGRMDLSGDESTTRTRFTEGRSARGVRDRVCETTILGADGAVVSHEQELFGDDQTIAPLCDAGAGWLRVTRQFLDSESRWVVLREVTYTANGLPLTVSTDGVTRSFAYDAQGLHPVTESVRASAERELRWQTTWNDLQQLPERVVDADGTVTVSSYDGLGRQIGVALGGEGAYLRYVYHATSPRPYVETFTWDGPVDAVPALPSAWTPGSHWRHTVAVLDSAGEPLFSATRLDVTRWSVSDRRVRDALGRTIAVSEPYEWSGELEALVASALPAQTPLRTVTYDALDRPVRQALADGFSSTRTYRAFETTAFTDGLAPVTTFLDGQGRIRRTERTVNGVVEAVDATYDVAGRLTAMRLPASGGAVVHEFRYDSLGRLVFATDPDIGDRELQYDDAGRLVAHTNGAGQTTRYAYDGAGRLVSRTGEDGAQYTYHYDVALDAAAFPRTAGRVAWVEEPTGTVQQGYDAFGRLTRVRRSIRGRTAEQNTTYSPSGLLLSMNDGDGFSFDVSYDAAGRPSRIGDLWQLEAQDAAGRILREHYGNGVVQSYERDLLGQSRRIRIQRPGGASLYDVALEYAGFGAISSVTDQDGTGLDHTASFDYDGGARLTSAILGQGPSAFRFSYAYDGLQNMIRRDVQADGATALRILQGQYRYGEPGADGAARGPRQLTSVVPDAGGAITTFDYDHAGRMVRQGQLQLEYDGFDELVRVHGVPGAGGQPTTIQYAYGHDGLRVATVGAGGEETLRFTPAITERADGTRDIDVSLGDRLIARVTRGAAPPGAATASVVATGARWARTLQEGLAIAGALFCVAALLLSSRARRRRRPLRLATAALLPMWLVLGGCSATTSQVASTTQALRTTTSIVYYHEAVGAGPSVITRADGRVLEERRYEPFGAPIDSYRDVEGSPGGVVSTVDYALDPHNILNKQSDAATGWSDHGARWMAPETGRWLTPDPPVKAPDPGFMGKPWSLHPYQYVNQNPIQFWDPDGKDGIEKKFGLKGGIIDKAIVNTTIEDRYGGKTTLKAGGGKVGLSKLNVKAEVYGLKVTHSNDVGPVTIEEQATVFSAGGQLGADGARWEVVVLQVKASGKYGPVKGGFSAGFGAGGGVKRNGTKVDIEIKLIIGVEVEVDFGWIATHTYDHFHGVDATAPKLVIETREGIEVPVRMVTYETMPPEPAPAPRPRHRAHQKVVSPSCADPGSDGAATFPYDRAHGAR